MAKDEMQKQQKGDDYNAYVRFSSPNVKFIISRIHNRLWVPSTDTTRIHRVNDDASPFLRCIFIAPHPRLPVR